MQCCASKNHAITCSTQFRHKKNWQKGLLVQQTIEEHQVRAELERILASNTFRARKSIRAFLRYAVQETLAGRGAQLNQYTIAVHALGKSPDFSPTTSPMVRIEAGRLRKLLDKHYQQYPASHGVMIMMQKGCYQPEFRTGNLPSPETTPSVSPITTGPCLLVHCYWATPPDAATQALCHKLRNELLGMLNRFHTFRVALSSMDACHAEPADTKQAAAQTYDYRLDCSLQPHSDGYEIFQTLSAAHHHELVWTGAFVLPLQLDIAQIHHLCQHIAANALALHSGKLLAHWARAQTSLNPAIAAHQYVLVSYLQFLRDINPATFRHALQTCAQRLEQFPHDSRALIIYARLCGYAHVLQYQDISDLEAAWTQAARMAVALEPDNAEAHSVFAHNCFLRGDYALCKAEFELARQLNPFDTSIEYLYAFGLYMIGEETSGIQLLQQLMQLAFTKPDWYYLLPFICAFNQGDYAQALTFAERIQQFSFWGELARCVSHYHLGQPQACQTEFQKLLTHPVFSATLQNSDKRGFFTYQAIQKILATLSEIKKTMI